MATLGQRRVLRATETSESPQTKRSKRDRTSEQDVESWDKTDRPLRFPARAHPEPNRADQNSDAETRALLRSQWLEEHDIRTEFLDAGIGCCWFAQQGECEPVAGETEEDAIARLALENGLPWLHALNALNTAASAA